MFISISKLCTSKIPININVLKKILAICLVVCFFISLFSSNFTNNRKDPIDGWYPETSRNMSIYIQPKINTTKIHPWKICQHDEKFLLLIVIITSPSHFKERQTIRETYGNTSSFNYPMFQKMHKHSSGEYLKIDQNLYEEFILPSQKNIQTPVEHLNFPVKMIFIIGQTVDIGIQNEVIKESNLNHDILQEDFLDSYNNLTIKSSMMLKWVTDYCYKNVKFVLKLDDDSFLNLPNLIQILLGGSVPVYQASLDHYNSKKSTHFENLLPYMDKLITGFAHVGAKPIADPKNKWYTPRYLYRGNEFPTYVAGPGYLMSIDAVKQLYAASIITPFFHMEDIYVTGLCAKVAHIIPRHHPLFYYVKLKDKCAIKGLISESELTPDELRDAYNLVTNDTACS